MSTHWKNALAASDSAMGGAAWNLGIEALAGGTDMATVFDDFNWVVPVETFGDATNWETMGWVLTDVGAPNIDRIGMNAAATATLPFDSCIMVDPGDAEDAGGNMQLDRVNASLPASSGGSVFPHIWVPESGAGATVLDNTSLVFACRLGLRADITTTGSGNWDGKCYVGFAEAGDVAILTAATGAITQAETGPLVGFHVGEDGSLDGISQRTVNTAYAAGTNFLELLPAGGVDGTVANGSLAAGDTFWVDLALRMDITDMSDDTANGSTTFYMRRVPRVPTGNTPGLRPTNNGVWRKMGVLRNQTPNNDVALVPTIEAISGPTAGVNCIIFLDWWAFGISRASRR